MRDTQDPPKPLGGDLPKFGVHAMAAGANVENSFKVYQHANRPSHALKEGFSWPAFFFGVFWMIYKNLWKEAALWVLLGTVALMTGSLSLVVLCLLQVFAGVLGNGWCAAKLLRDGYIGAYQVSAPSAELALKVSGPQILVSDSDRTAGRGDS